MDALIGSKRKQKEVGFDKSKGRLARIKEGVISARIDLTEALKKRDTVKWLTSFCKHKARDSMAKTVVRWSDHYQILGEGGQQPSVDENYRTGSQGDNDDAQSVVTVLGPSMEDQSGDVSQDHDNLPSSTPQSFSDPGPSTSNQPSQPAHRPTYIERKRAYMAGQNNPNQMHFNVMLNNFIVYKRYVSEIGEEAAFQRCVQEVSELQALAARTSYHHFIGTPELEQ